VIDYISLGDEVLDKVTGWRGIVIAYQVRLGGVEEFEVQKRDLNSEGNTQEQWFNEMRLEKTGGSVDIGAAIKIRRPIGFGAK
jgi:hypothetical protein